MNPQEALELIDKVCATFKGNRADHVNIQQAIVVLNKVINPETAPKDKKPEE